MQFAEREFAQSYIATIGVDFKIVYCQRGSGAYVKLQGALLCHNSAGLFDPNL
jgi:hypothetical protein